MAPEAPCAEHLLQRAVRAGTSACRNAPAGRPPGARTHGGSLGRTADARGRKRRLTRSSAPTDANTVQGGLADFSRTPDRDEGNGHEADERRPPLQLANRAHDHEIVSGSSPSLSRIFLCPSLGFDCNVVIYDGQIPIERLLRRLRLNIAPTAQKAFRKNWAPAVRSSPSSRRLYVNASARATPRVTKPPNFGRGVPREGVSGNLIEHVLPSAMALRQWVLTFPFSWREGLRKTECLSAHNF